jgi:hypothetical protein
MNKFLTLIAAFALTMGVAVAGNQTQSNASSSTSSASQSAATNAGNSQNVTFTSPSTLTETLNGTTTSNQNVVISGSTSQRLDQTVRNVPNVNVSELTTSNDTCMGSIVAGGSAVGFGVSFGTTHVDQNCVMLKNAQMLWNMGMRAAALARLCMDKDNRKALEMTGYTCPQDRKNTTDVKTVTAVSTK